MPREIVLKGQTIPYTLRLSKRAKYVNVTIKGNGDLIVSLPHKLPEEYSKKFLMEKEDWICKHVNSAIKSGAIILPKHNKKEREFYREYARIYVHKKIAEVKRRHDFKVNKVYIKNQTSQWGSCSSKNNLNFNYKLIFLPTELAEYVVAHELCHLREFSHSEKFWALIENIVPNSKKLDKEIQKYHLV